MLNRILFAATVAYAFSLTPTLGQQCSSCVDHGGEDTMVNAVTAVESLEACETCGVGHSYFDAGTRRNACNVSNNYVRLFAGRNNISNLDSVDFREGWGAGLTIGKDDGRIRREWEYIHRNNSFDSLFSTGTANQFSTMFNLLMDVDCLKLGQSQFYVGGGIGLTTAVVEFDGLMSTDSDMGFSYQAIAGLTRPLRFGGKLKDRARRFVEYRYHATAYDDLGAAVSNHSVFSGIEFLR